MNPENLGKLERRVWKAAEDALTAGNFTTSIDVLLGLGWLSMNPVEAWRQGRIACLEAEAISKHTALHGSGRVGRSAAGRALDAEALPLAATANVRHRKTRYDDLLMSGTDRSAVRALVADEVRGVLDAWRRPR
jgi:hypothetical protein